MAKKLKSQIIKKDVKDMKGITIKKGTKIFVIKQFYLIHFRTHEKEKFTKCLIDNGSGIYDLMPETAFKIGTGKFVGKKSGGDWYQ